MKLTSLVRKELRQYFNTPTAYVAIVIFLAATSGWLFYVDGFFARGVATLRPYFALMPVMFVFFVPAVTMRTWAEERRTRTDEFLMALPYSTGEIVCAKAIASFGVLALALLLTAPVPFFVTMLGRFDPGPIVTEYLGTMLFGAAATAVGCLASSITRNQVTAFLVAAAALGFLLVLDTIVVFVGLDGVFARVVSYVSWSARFESFVKGIIDSRDVVFFVAVTAAMLRLTVHSVEAGKSR